MEQPIEEENGPETGQSLFWIGHLVAVESLSLQ
jgi:hypothetical protein